MRTRVGRRVAHRFAGLGVAVAVLALTACGGGASDQIHGGGQDDSGKTSLSLVAYSAPQPGFDAVSAGFGRTSAGSDVRFAASYGASGDQSRKVVAGLPTDLVSFSVEPDMDRVVKAGIVDRDWNQGRYHGIPFGSVVALVVRKGNPKNIHDWSDLLRPGVRVVTPDPLSSGSAMWNLLAPYAAESNGGADPQAGLDYVRHLVGGHLAARPSSARDATDLFLQGSGDVLISYENEAIFTQRTGGAVDYVDPPRNLRIENPFAVVKDTKHPQQARDFADYMYSTAGQRLWAQSGFRPVDPAVAAQFTAQFPPLQKVWTVADLGGWNAVSAQLFDKSSGAITKIYSSATG